MKNAIIIATAILFFAAIPAKVAAQTATQLNLTSAQKKTVNEIQYQYVLCMESIVHNVGTSDSNQKLKTCWDNRNRLLIRVLDAHQYELFLIKEGTPAFVQTE